MIQVLIWLALWLNPVPCDEPGFTTDPGQRQCAHQLGPVVRVREEP